MAAVKIGWKTVTRIAKGPSTGETAPAEDASPFDGMTKPCVVFVADATAPMADFEKIETIVFANEKIGLAMKAFDAVRIAPEDADDDAILGGHGKGVPRVLVVDPAKQKVKVLEEKKIKVSGLYKLMKSTAGSFYKEKLDKLVKSHLKFLTEQDQLANQIEQLQEKEGRLAGETGKKAEKDMAKIKEELAEVEKELGELKTKQDELWKLTPKNAAA